MSNQILTISQITAESARVLEGSLTFAKGVNREYDDAFAIKGAKIGNTLNMRLPARYLGRTGPTLSIEAQTETFVPLTLTTQFGVDTQFTSADMELSMDDFSERVIKPAMATVANKIDSDGLALANQIYNAVGTPGTTPANLTPYLSAMATLDYFMAPRDGNRSIVINPGANATIVGTLTNLFNPTNIISKQYESGNMGSNTIGAKWSMDQNVASYTVGSLGGSPTVDGTVGSLTGSILSTKGWTAAAASRLNVGDVFTIASVFGVNPQSRLTTGQLQQFVVTAAFSSLGTGKGNVSISPAIVTSGQFQNVNSLPVDGAVITVLGSASTVSPMNLLFHKDAFVLGSADLPLPKGVHAAARVADKKLGMSVRMIQDYDPVNDLFINRLDVLYGWAILYPQLACRIQG